MRRLHVILPDEESCKAVVGELESAGVPEHHLHVVASVAHDLGGLPEASVWQKTELAHGIEWGVGLGGVAGLIGGVLAVTFPPAGLVLGGGALLAGTAAGAGVGGAVSALLASHQHNHDLDYFRREIGAGKLLLMVDVPRGDVDATREMILKHHPEADIGVLKPKD
jgi:hypothetical protein